MRRRWRRRWQGQLDGLDWARAARPAGKRMGGRPAGQAGLGGGGAGPVGLGGGGAGEGGGRPSGGRGWGRGGGWWGQLLPPQSSNFSKQ